MTTSPRQEFELAIGGGKKLSDLSAECIRGIRNNLPFDTPANGDKAPDSSVSAITPDRFLREFRHQWHRDCQHGDKVTECLDGSCLALFAAEGGLRAAVLSSDRAVHPELIAKWRKASDLADKHPPFSYEQGVCVGIGYCADELETGRDDAIESIGNDELAASDRAVKEPEQSPAVKKAMERFWKRCAEVDGTAEGQTASPASQLDLEPIKAHLAELPLNAKSGWYPCPFCKDAIAMVAEIERLRAEVSSPARPQLNFQQITGGLLDALLDDINGPMTDESIDHFNIVGPMLRRPDVEQFIARYLAFATLKVLAEGAASSAPPALEQTMDRLENHYNFECPGGPLRNCVEWQQLKADLARLRALREEKS